MFFRFDTKSFELEKLFSLWKRQYLNSLSDVAFKGIINRFVVKGQSRLAETCLAESPFGRMV
jgi:hypothetical protein